MSAEELWAGLQGNGEEADGGEASDDSDSFVNWDWLTSSAGRVACSPMVAKQSVLVTRAAAADGATSPRIGHHAAQIPAVLG